MDEQDKQHSNSPKPVSDDGNKRRSSRRRNRKRRGNQPEPEVQQPEMQVAAEEPQQPRSRGGNAAKPKRRNAPRRSPVPDLNGPEEVVRATAPTIAPIQPMRLRKIDADDTSEPIFGCPMLSRTRLEIPFRGNQRVARCSAGWSVHDEDEVLFCMHTPTVAQCWKDNPEQLEALIERLRPVIEAELSATEQSVPSHPSTGSE